MKAFWKSYRQWQRGGWWLWIGVLEWRRAWWWRRWWTWWWLWLRLCNKAFEATEHMRVSHGLLACLWRLANRSYLCLFGYLLIAHLFRHFQLLQGFLFKQGWTAILFLTYSGSTLFLLVITPSRFISSNNECHHLYHTRDREGGEGDVWDSRNVASRA